MKITVEGTVYEWDPESLLVSEGIEIQRLTDMTMRYWNHGIIEGESIPRKALAYLLKKRAGEKVDWEALDFRLVDMVIDYGDETEDDEAAAADPTGAETSSSA